MAFRVLFDACVLLPYQLCDLLLRLGETDIYQPAWSEDILEEVRRNLVKSFGKTEEQATRRVGFMRTAFPHAMVTGHDALVPAMTNDPKDRHVLAAAVHGQAALIVTANLKDFPASALSPYSIEAVHPEAFLQDQLDLHPTQTLQCLQEQRAAYSRPGMTRSEFYQSFRATVPGFADAAETMEIQNGSLGPTPVTEDDGDAAPLPLEIVSGEAAQEAFFPGDAGPDPTTPLGAAFLWYLAIRDADENRGALEQLTYNPADWNGYASIAASLEGWAMMQNIHYNEEDPDNIAYARFMPDTGWSMRAFADVPLSEVKILTLVRCPDSWWRVWGISTNYIPSANRINHGIDD